MNGNLPVGGCDLHVHVYSCALVCVCVCLVSCVLCEFDVGVLLCLLSVLTSLNMDLRVVGI